MDKDSKVILITNDDGIDAPGIHRLVECVAHLGRVVVVAPDGPRSAQSSAVTVGTPMRLTSRGEYCGAELYSVNGTPVDCVKLAIHVLFADRLPDLLLSGINHGSNSAINVIYSGTMAAVFEGCLVGIPSVGFSYHSHNPASSLDACNEVVAKVVDTVVAKGLPEGICLNVNIPKCEKVKGIKVARGAKGYWTEEYADYTDPMGKPFYWLTGHFHNLEPDATDTDLYWTDNGYASVTPCRPEQYALDYIEPIAAILD